MYKKLEEETINYLLETGIDEFAEKGLDRANINHIAKKAGVSVGVIYKYYGDKDNFFLSCVEHSLKFLEDVIGDVIDSDSDLKRCVRLLINRLIEGAEKHPNYYVMYNEITAGSCRKYAAKLASEIEGKTANLYAGLIAKGQEEGKVVDSENPKIAAFFFDNLLMMLQFAFSCEYYKERFLIFCGEEIVNDKEALADAFCAFVERAIGIR